MTGFARNRCPDCSGITARFQSESLIGFGRNMHATAVERHLCTRTVNRVFDEMAKALPPHVTGPEVSEDKVQAYLESVGQ